MASELLIITTCLVGAVVTGPAAASENVTFAENASENFTPAAAPENVTFGEDASENVTPAAASENVTLVEDDLENVSPAAPSENVTAAAFSENVTLAAAVSLKLLGISLEVNSTVEMTNDSAFDANSTQASSIEIVDVQPSGESGIFEDAQVGWYCLPGRPCETICGDGFLRGAEECDDGNQVDRDGCDGACHIESGWQCADQGQPCYTVCGDGLVGLPIEQCDDENTLPYDGCSASCQWEAGMCAVQAAHICTGSLAPRSDVPRFRFCAEKICSTRECCQPVQGKCQSHTGTVLQCSDGHRKRAGTVVSLPRLCTGEPGEPPCIPGCKSFSCPLGWTPSSRPIVCEESACNLTACCDAVGSSCTCAKPECCSDALTPPQLIHAGSKGGLEFDLIEPIVVSSAGREHWYFYLRRGVTSLVELSKVLGSTISEEMRTMELKGYFISIPTFSELLTLISRSAPAASIATSNWHVWSATQADASPGSYWAVHAGNVTTGSSVSSYYADMALEKYIIFNVTEVFTVTHEDLRLHRLVLRDGMPCCFVDDPKFVEGVPAEIAGATYFALPGGEHDGREAGTFVLMSKVPAMVYAVAIHDARGNYKYNFESGFSRLGWQHVASPGFRLMPWRFPMGFWKFRLDPGVVLQVPHHAGMYGAVAMKLIRSV